MRAAEEALATLSSVNRLHLQPSPTPLPSQMNGSLMFAHCTPPPVSPMQPPAPWLEIAREAAAARDVHEADVDVTGHVETPVRGVELAVDATLERDDIQDVDVRVAAEGEVAGPAIERE